MYTAVVRTGLVVANFLWAAFAFSQTPTVMIAGQVTDSDTMPLARVKISDINSAATATTNKAGIFFMRINRSVTVLRFSLTGYTTLDKNITAADLDASHNDTVFVRCILQTRVEQLTTVEIIDQKIQMAYNKPSILVLDYDFHPQGLLLLVKENKQYHVRLVDDNSTTLADKIIRKNPTALYRDCYNNTHIMYADSVFQVYATGNHIIVMDSVEAPLFSLLIEPCMAATRQKLYLREFANHNKSIVYFSIDKKTTQKKLVHVIADREAERYAAWYYQKVMASAGYLGALMSNSAQDLARAREVQQDLWFYEKSLSKPIYNPLVKLRDSLFVFDHVADTMFVFTESGKLKRTSVIDYHYLPGWKQELITDDTGKDIYAKCVRGGLVYLVKLDAYGKAVKEYRLDTHAFPEKVKVLNGYAYYLHTQTDEFSIQHVYKQRLE